MVAPRDEPAATPAPPARPKSDRSALTVYLLVATVLVVAFFSWRSCSYLVPLTDAEVASYLQSDNPADVHRAISEVSRRLEGGDEDVGQFFPRIIELAEDDDVRIRIATAWVMQYAPGHEPFAPVLEGLLTDECFAARTQAACSLAARRDPAGRGVLREALDDYEVLAPRDAKISMTLLEGEPVRAGERLARLVGTDDVVIDLPVPLDGEISAVAAQPDQQVASGDLILTITPSDDQVLAALVALFFVGMAEDLPAVERVIEQDRASARTLQQAELTRARLASL